MRAAHPAGHHAGHDERGEQRDHDRGTGDVGVALGVVGDRRTPRTTALSARSDSIFWYASNLRVLTAHQFSGVMPCRASSAQRAGVRGGETGQLRDHRRRVGRRRHVVGVLGLGLLGHGRAVLLELLLGVLELLGVGLGAAADVLLDRDALQVGVRGERDALAGEAGWASEPGLTSMCMPMERSRESAAFVSEIA